MSRNGSGTYSLPAGNPVVSGTVITTTWANTTLSDIATALTNSITKNGETTPTANLPMGTYKHTGVATATALTDYARADQVQNSTLQYLTSVSGSDTITANAAITPAAYASGQSFFFVSAGANTGPATLNVSSLGAKSITKNGSTELVAGDIPSGAVVEVAYDGTRFQLLGVGLKAGDIGVTVQGYDADTAKLDVAQTWTNTQRTQETTDNDGSFDLSAALDFECTPTAGFALTFTNIPASPNVQRGSIFLVNGSNYAITAHANTKVTSTLLATISVTGTYILAYETRNGLAYVTSAGAFA